MIGGPKSLYTGGSMAVYPPKGWIIATSSWGSGRRGDSRLGDDRGFIGVWNIKDKGDVPPRWVLGGPRGTFQHIRTLMVADKRLNAVLTFSFPEIF
jgi:hypothetical protein